MSARPRNSLAAPPLSQRLTLAEWFAYQLGYSSGREMLEDLKDSEGERTDGRHPALIRALNRAGTGVEIPEDALLQMDDAIRADLAAINRHRTPPIELKYFQYLAALSVENFLRRYSTGPDALRAELQWFATKRRGPHYPFPQSAEEMRKLALWIATGGGKTLLMHLNYRQFLRRRKSGLFSPDNVILLTPHETLSAQHIAEMRLSGIPCVRHGEERGGLSGMEGENPVRVLEITKLAPKTRSGRSPIMDAFSDSRNLVFVDEGHKGAGGSAWFERKRKLAERGFLIEYSATFGQAAATADRERAEEYAHAIALDYSYRHFHADGYGKEFDVVNLSDNPAAKKRDTLMLGNLLVFLQQRMCFAENRGRFARHNLEPPLLLMLGATVTGQAETTRTTDVAEFAGFLHRVALDRRDGAEWLQNETARILAGDSKIGAGEDVFFNRLRWLREKFGEKNGKKADAVKVCAALRKHVFRASAPGALQFCAVPGAKGEAALRVGGGKEPFGLIYVGDVIPKLREIVRRVEPGITLFEESSLGRYFPGVAGPASPINILIGARKFMEGWNSWRVSGMGLLHVGMQEGPLIFQLFGRGVRLKGEGMSLKRDCSPSAPLDLTLLETMNIFGVEANFISKFRQMLEKEGVWKETLRLKISEPLEKALRAKLRVPEYPSEGFAKAVMLAADDNIRAELDLSSSAMRIRGGQDAPQTAQAKTETGLSEEAIASVNWDDLRRELLAYRSRAGMWNLIVPPKNLRDIFDRRCCLVKHDADSPLEPASRRDIRRIQETAFAMARKYADKFYAARRGEWEAENIRYAPLTKGHPYLPKTREYTLRVPVGNKELIEAIQALANNDELWRQMRDNDDLPKLPPRVHFCNHLYQPLLLKGGDTEIFPPGLNEGEKKFVANLRMYLWGRRPREDEEIFLLRNQSQTGLEFHSADGRVFPDFILWIKRGKKQRIVFVEPHGMRFARAPKKDPHVQLHEKLCELSAKLAQTPDGEDIEMDSFIVSQTPYNDLRENYDTGDWDEEKFKQHHILFPDRTRRYIADILRWDD